MVSFFRAMRVSALVLCGGLACRDPASAQVKGTATYRERIALPPNAVFEATLEDVSRADAPADVIGRARIERPGNPPISFEIPYDSSRIDPRRQYAVRARILVDDRLMFTTDQSYPVLTGGHGKDVSLLLRRSSGSASTGGGSKALGSLPATFTGDLPCADCPGIRYRLDLFPDSAFFRRLTHLGKADQAGSDDIGRWVVSTNGDTLVLFGGSDTPVRLAIRSVDTLRVLGPPAAPSSARTDLTRTTSAEPLEPRLRLRGMYSYMADAGRFTECLTGRTWPVAQEGDNARLENAYGKVHRQPAETLLVEVDGQVAMRPRMEGDGQEQALVVERFGGVWPGETCGSPTSTEPLENTYWKLTRLGDSPVRVTDQQREPHFILHPDSHRVSGSSGCNRLMGGYERQGNRLTFRQMAGTMMACPDGMEIERPFLDAMQKVSTTKITRQHLDVFDASGKFLARFEARHMK